MTSFFRLSFASFAFLLLTNLIAAGQSGSLDPTFGSGGVSTISATPYGTANRNAVLQSDGKIVLLYGAPNASCALVRFNADGGADTSFGTGGIRHFNWPASDGSYGIPEAVVLQNDGGVEKIIVAGYTKSLSGRKSVDSLRVDRFLPDGTLDSSFGAAGSAIYQTAYASAVAVQQNDLDPAHPKIITLSGGKLVRLNSDGKSIDSSFGSNGGADVSSLLTSGRAILIQPDGQIVAAGSVALRKKTSMAVVRLSENGVLDLGFGSGGRTVIDFAADSSAYNVQLTADGRIFLGGTNGPLSPKDVAVARLAPSGLLEAKASYDFAGLNDFGYGLALQSDGKVLAGGGGYISSGNPDFAMVRFDQMLGVDPSFGTAGEVTTDIFGRNDYANSILIQKACPVCDEKIVVVGSSYDGSQYYATAARYIP